MKGQLLICLALTELILIHGPIFGNSNQIKPDLLGKLAHDPIFGNSNQIRPDLLGKLVYC